MQKKTFLGVMESEDCGLQALVLAEDAAAAKERVLSHFSKGLGRTCRAEEVRIIPFGNP